MIMTRRGNICYSRIQTQPAAYAFGPAMVSTGSVREEPSFYGPVSKISWSKTPVLRMAMAAIFTCSAALDWQVVWACLLAASACQAKQQVHQVQVHSSVFVRIAGKLHHADVKCD
ncbi:hypothetical protein WJX77_004187 [Trebouxia sp. C0004]